MGVHQESSPSGTDSSRMTFAGLLISLAHRRQKDRAASRKTARVDAILFEPAVMVIERCTLAIKCAQRMSVAVADRFVLSLSLPGCSDRQDHSSRTHFHVEVSCLVSLLLRTVL